MTENPEYPMHPGLTPQENDDITEIVEQTLDDQIDAQTKPNLIVEQ